MSTNSKPDIYIEVVPTGGAVSPQALTDNFVKATHETLRKVGEIIETSCIALVEHIESLDKKPDSISIEFGVNVGAEGSIPFISKGSIGANFKVAVSWGWK